MRTGFEICCYGIYYQLKITPLVWVTLAAKQDIVTFMKGHNLKICELPKELLPQLKCYQAGMSALERKLNATTVIKWSICQSLRKCVGEADVNFCKKCVKYFETKPIIQRVL